MNPFHSHFDVVGDIHGHLEKVLGLLEMLGYQPRADYCHHPEGRKLIFIGDYIDRGSKVREALHLVRRMVDAGEAFALMGNHEYNAICYHPLRLRHLHKLPNYPTDAPPVLCGHYWMNPFALKTPLAANVACVDYHAGLGPHALFAYRWNEGEPLHPGGFLGVQIPSP